MNFDFVCDGIMLEPRLQEYIKKKMYYKENNIQPDIPFEQEFNITKGDLKRVKAFLKGDKDIYNNKKIEKYITEDEAPRELDQEQGFTDADEMYKSDPRFHRYLKKVQREKDAKSQRVNYMNYDDGRYFNSILNEEYRPINSKDCIDRSFPDPNRNVPKIEKDYDNHNRYMYGNPFQGQDRRVYNSAPPTVQNNLRVYPMKNNKPTPQPTVHQPRTGHAIGELETYAAKINRTYRRGDDLDMEFSFADNNRKLGKMDMGLGMRDISIENELQNRTKDYTRRYSPDKSLDQAYLEQNSGLPERGSKSYGYENPFEHYFQYISDDIQDPAHVVIDRPFASRLLNQRVARSRDVY